MVRPGSHIRNPQRDPRNPKVSTPVSSWLNFNPLQLQPDLWLDASDTTTITESGGAVSQWDDKSGNGKNFVQATGINQPTTGTRTQNNLNVIDFDGSNNFFTGGDSFDILNGGVSFFVVVKYDSSAAGTIMGKMRADLNSGRYFLNRSGGTLNWFFQDTANRQANISDTNTVCRLLTYVLTRDSNPGLIGYVNRLSVASSLTAGSTSYNTTDLFFIGAFASSTGGTPPSAGNYLDGFIAEIILCMRPLTNGEKVATENYLNTKWGLGI